MLQCSRIKPDAGMSPYALEHAVVQCAALLKTAAHRNSVLNRPTEGIINKFVNQIARRCLPVSCMTTGMSVLQLHDPTSTFPV